MRRPPAQALWGVTAFVALLAVAIAFELGPCGETAVASVQRQRVSTEEIGDGRLPKILSALGRLKSRRPEGPEVRLPAAPEEAARVEWQVSRPAVGAFAPPVAEPPISQPAKAELPASGPANAASGSGVRRLALEVAPEALEKILAQPRQRLEAPAEMRLMQGDRLLYEGFAGLRLHGGRSRSFGPARSWRLVFRPSQGAPGLPPGLLGWDGEVPLTRLVVHGDQRRDATGRLWRLTNPMALEVAARLGAATPATAPALLEINGRAHGLVFLTEPIGLNYLRRHRGHDRFVLVRAKRDRRESRWRAGDGRHWRLAQKWWQRESNRGFDEIAARYDLASLEAWFLASLACGTTDAYQGALVRDETDPLGRWSWIAWDMDQSFMAARRPMTEPWREDVWEHLLRRHRDDFRSQALRSLIRGSTEYRRRLGERARWALEERLDAAFVADLVARYRRLVQAYGVDDEGSLDRIEAFLEQRPAVLRPRIAQRLERGALTSAGDAPETLSPPPAAR